MPRARSLANSSSEFSYRRLELYFFQGMGLNAAGLGLAEYEKTLHRLESAKQPSLQSDDHGVASLRRKLTELFRPRGRISQIHKQAVTELRRLIDSGKLRVASNVSSMVQ